MIMHIKKHIPNILTCCNLIMGCVSIMAALKGNLKTAGICIVIAAIFDFLDGFLARLLNVQSAIGKELDSLADIVSFGLAPSMILYVWLTHCMLDVPPSAINEFTRFLPMIVLLVPALSAVRLAKFNTDEKQEVEFSGLPTPANAFFIGFIPEAEITLFSNFWILLLITVVFSILLVSPIPMFSLKFKHFKWKGNEAKYILLIIAVILLSLFKLGAFPLIILIYLLISLIISTIHKLQIV